MVWGERKFAYAIGLEYASASGRARTFQSNVFTQMYDTSNKLLINNLSQTRVRRGDADTL